MIVTPPPDVGGVATCVRVVAEAELGWLLTHRRRPQEARFVVPRRWLPRRSRPPFGDH